MRKIITICMMMSSMAACAEMALQNSPPDIEYIANSNIYQHNIFATPHEFGMLKTSDGQIISAQKGSVFEGIAPISFYSEVEGKNYIVATQSDLKLGSYLALYQKGNDGQYVLVDQGKPIGQSHRWLALSFAQDFDGNGYPEIGYIETPHLNGTAKLYEVVDGKLVFKTQYEGVTNHVIGTDEIFGGLKKTGDDAYWAWELRSQTSGEWVQLIWDGQSLTEKD